MTLWKEIRAQEAEIIRIYRDLHQIPELGMQERKTTQYIRDALKDYPLEIRDIGMDVGLCVLIRGEQPGHTVALRADIDALPLEEESGLPFASQHPGLFHACGHDLHAAVAICAARWLSTHRDQLNGNVWVYFQPAEELLCGAQKMIEAGCLELEPRPESILMLHTSPALESGQFGLFKGPTTCSSDVVRITVKSSGGHGAYPHRCGDTVLAAGTLVSQLQMAVSRDNDCMRPAVMTFGSIHGGAAPNVIPAEVVVEGTLRTLYPESRKTIKNSVRRISEGVCTALQTECTVEFLEPSVHSVNNDPAIIDRAEATVRKLFGEDVARYLSTPTSGSEDFANYLQYIPGAMIRLGTRNSRDPQTALGQHSAAVRFDEGSLAPGVAFLCQYVLDSLCAE